MNNRIGFYGKYWTVLSLCAVIVLLVMGANNAFASDNPLSLGPASDYNEFVFDNAARTSSRTGGRIAAGSANLENYYPGVELAACNPTDNVVAIDGNVDYNFGTISNGSGVAGGSVNSNNGFDCPGSSFTANGSTGIDFGSAETELTNLATGYATSETTGEVKADNNECVVIFEGDNPDLNVFNINGSLLENPNPDAGTCPVEIRANCGSTVLINISGSSLNLERIDLRLVPFNSALPIERGQVLYNIFEATTVTMNNSDFEGSVLAPNAAFTGENFAFVNGTLVAQSLDGTNFDTHNFPFGTDPDCSDPELDYGDLPASFGITTQLENGARHGVSDLYLGDSVDADADGQTSPNANGDDNDGNDDEDGVAANTSAWTTGTNGGSVTVSSTGEGCLNGWIDWNGNSSFADAGDHVLVNVQIGAGNTNLSFDIPNGGLDATSYARYRLTPRNQFGTCSSVEPTGYEDGGEVEDYAYIFSSGSELDYGDLPPVYNNTTSGDNGAAHIISDLYLGNSVDTESDGQESANADGDDNDGNDDEDGVSADTATWREGTDGGSVTVTSTGPGCLNAWVDWNRDGDFNDSGEQILVNASVNGGSNDLIFDIPAGALNSTTYARYRLTPRNAQGGCTDSIAPTGTVNGGEVEDYAYTFGLDFGDLLAAVGYPTLLADNGPRHTLSTDLYLGDGVDGEADAGQAGNSSGDDVNGTDDEDGVAFSADAWRLDQTDGALLIVNTVGEGCLNVWLDSNFDRDFGDANEHVVVNLPISTGMSSVPFTILGVDEMDPNFGAPTGLRVRLSPRDDQGACTAPVASTGLVIGGEVEDYDVVLANATAVGLSEFGFDDHAAEEIVLTFILAVIGTGFAITATRRRR